VRVSWPSEWYGVNTLLTGKNFETGAATITPRGLVITHKKMRVPFPASRGAFRLRFRFFDVVWALVSPVVALYLAQAYLLYSNVGAQTIALYCLTSFAFSVLALLIFNVQDGMARYFSVYDALDICKAVIAAELVTCITLFGLTRLEGIPRSAPVIHALILAAGLISVRALTRVLADDRANMDEVEIAPEHVIMIGSNPFSSMYIKLLHACAANQQRVVAVLDGKPEMFGRTIAGVRVVGTPGHLDAIIDEYVVHGLEIDRVVVGGESDILSGGEMNEIRKICDRRKIALDFVPQLVGLSGSKARPKKLPAEDKGPTEIMPSAYFRWKNIIDFCAASIMLLVLLPLLAGVGLLVLLDVGSPVLFWQQRLGKNGRRFLLYKFRTLRPPFDWRGEPTPEDQRLSWIGQLLRETSLDELPQLLNVLVGDMSLIGPRPLLQEDQPADASVRLIVRPGITGWAQVNGRKSLTAEEKDKLDEWYIRNASVSLDLQITLKTIQMLLMGARQSNGSSVTPDAVVAGGASGWKSLEGQGPVASHNKAMRIRRKNVLGQAKTRRGL